MGVTMTDPERGGANGPAGLPDGPETAPPEAAVAGGAEQTRSGLSTRRAGLLVAGLGALGLLALKFVLPLVIASIAAQSLGAVFGDPYARLPSDVREEFDERVDAAAGERFRGLSDDEQLAMVQGLVARGLARLDDATLVAYFRLASTAFQRTDVSTCATVARAMFVGATPSAETNLKVVGALDEAGIRQWVDISVEALEAEARGHPAARTVTDASIDPLVADVVGQMTAGDLETVGAIAGGETVSDVSACSAIRGYFGAVLALPPAELALMARYDVSP